jgi:hypothetical protein
VHYVSTISAHPCVIFRRFSQLALTSPPQLRFRQPAHSRSESCSRSRVRIALRGLRVFTDPCSLTQMG